MNGYGRLINQNGDVYIGEFQNGFKQGDGSMYFYNGDIYIGQWKRNTMNG